MSETSTGTVIPKLMPSITAVPGILIVRAFKYGVFTSRSMGTDNH
jgi:hypothetical protein